MPDVSALVRPADEAAADACADEVERRRGLLGLALSPRRLQFGRPPSANHPPVYEGRVARSASFIRLGLGSKEEDEAPPRSLVRRMSW